MTNISNNVSTSESYTCTYGSLSLQAPFSPYTAYPAVTKLNNVYYNTTSQQHYFGYSSDNSGSLFTAALPNGGVFAWTYQNSTYGNGATFREISQRQLSKEGSNYTTYTFSHDS